MSVQEYLMTLGIESKLLLAGMIGTIAGISGKKMGWIAWCGSLFTGVGGAIYLTPLASELLGLTSDQSRLGIAVLIGYVGITGIQKILIKKLDEWKR